MKYIDNFLNRITMYRLVLYYLIALVVAAMAFGMFGLMPYNPLSIGFSLLVILVASWVSNKIFAWAFDAVPNSESVYITAFILVLIVSPVIYPNISGMLFLSFVSAWAMASKYIFAIGKKHIFNPAAFAVALAAFVGLSPATWWVAGNIPLLPFILIGGFLIVRKIKRADLFWSFTIVSLIAVAYGALPNPVSSIWTTLLHSSFFFFAFVMLTEPLTTPPTRWLQIFYGAIIGLLFAPNIHIGSFYFTPELALLAGNIFSYCVSPKGRAILTLVERNKLANNTYEFVFRSDRRIYFRPGQYLEWTLGRFWPDSRGNRRYFTIASSPKERYIRMGVKFYAPPSKFKRALAKMKAGDVISASHLAGDFVLPKNKKQKMVFIAGGIGVTPFRSMIQYLVDAKEKRQAILLYSNRSADDISYKDVFDQAEKVVGLKTKYFITDEDSPLPDFAHAGAIDSQSILRDIPDYHERTFYVSGPPSMVNGFRETLRDMGVSKRRIKTDFFPGFV